MFAAFMHGLWLARWSRLKHKQESDEELKILLCDGKILKIKQQLIEQWSSKCEALDGVLQFENYSSGSMCILHPSHHSKKDWRLIVYVLVFISLRKRCIVG